MNKVIKKYMRKKN